MPVEFVVRLNDDGTVTWFGLSLDTPNGGTAYNVAPDGMSKALETIQETFPGATVVDEAAKPSASLSGPSIADQIRAAQDHEDLEAVWRANKDDWTAEHNKLAANRKKEIGK